MSVEKKLSPCLDCGCAHPPIHMNSTGMCRWCDVKASATDTMRWAHKAIIENMRKQGLYPFGKE